jgi:hypothetical protein
MRRGGVWMRVFHAWEERVVEICEVRIFGAG